MPTDSEYGHDVIYNYAMDHMISKDELIITFANGFSYHFTAYS